MSTDPTHIVYYKHDDVRFPPEGTRVRLWANDDGVQMMSWRTSGLPKSHLVSPFFIRNHLRSLRASEIAASVYA